MSKRLIGLGFVAGLLGSVGSAGAYIIRFDRLVPGTTNLTSHTEGGFTLGSTGGWIFIGGASDDRPSGPVVFSSSVNTSFELTGRPFSLKSIDLGALNSNSGARVVQFVGKLADGGGTISQTFTTGTSITPQTFTFPSSFQQRLSSVRWTPGQVVIDNIDVPQGPAMTFSSLASFTRSHVENGYRLRSTGDIFVGTGTACRPDAPVVFSSSVTSVFTFESVDSKPFDLFTIDMGALNAGTGAQDVTFTGLLADGGTVSQTFTTGASITPATFAFGPEFTNLLSVQWTPGQIVMDNIVANVYVPEPSSLAAMAGVAALLLRRRT